MRRWSRHNSNAEQNHKVQMKNNISSKLIEEKSLRSRTEVFKDRIEAGWMLAEKLEKYKGKDVIVLSIPAGGVPVGYAIAKKLSLTMDIIVVRKLPVPSDPEAGFGAIAMDGTIILNESMVNRIGITKAQIEMIASRRLKEIQLRMEKFRGEREFPELKKKTAILVDDGLASGYTMLAAIHSIRTHEPSGIVVAVPTASKSAIETILPNVDEMVCLNIRSGVVFAVADAYVNWYDLGDDEVVKYLNLR